MQLDNSLANAEIFNRKKLRIKSRLQAFPVSYNRLMNTGVASWKRLNMIPKTLNVL
jgi:hypothetical protein